LNVAIGDWQAPPSMQHLCVPKTLFELMT
jgi:hypothetical protein